MQSLVFVNYFTIYVIQRRIVAVNKIMFIIFEYKLSVGKCVEWSA
jgi:hypothetical protein